MKITLDQCGEQTCLRSHVSMYSTQHDPKWPLVTETVRFRTSLCGPTPAAGNKVYYDDKEWQIMETKLYPHANRAIADCRRISVDPCSATKLDVYQYNQDMDCDGEDYLTLVEEQVDAGVVQVGTTSGVINGGRAEVRQYRVYSPSAASWTHLTILNGSVDLKVQEVVTEADSVPYALCVEHPFPLSEA